MSDRDLVAIARRVAASARGGEEIEAYVVRSRDVDVQVFDGEVESLSVAVIEGVGVRVLSEQRTGYAWAGSLDDDVVDDAIADARDNAEFGSADEFAVMASPEDVSDVAAVELDLWRDELLTVPTERKVALALEMEAVARALDARVRGVESADYGDAAVESAMVTSLGVEAFTRRTGCSCSVTALAGEGAATQTGSGFSLGRSFEDLDLHQAATDAVQRAVRMLGARQPPTRKLPVILDPLVTRSLIGLIGGALNGESINKGRSLFVGRAGEQVAAAGVTLVDDPTLVDAFGAATHDAEGVPTRRTPLVAAGRLDAFLHNLSTARRAGATTTASAVRGGFKSPPGVGARALFLEPGALSAEEILAAAPEALFVQSVSGLHSGTNLVSGDFSVGAEGLMVRGGELAEPVREITIASTLQRMLHDVVEVGSDLRWLPGGAAGMTLLLDEMAMSGA